MCRLTEVFAVCIVDERQSGIGEKAADQYGLRFNHVAVTLFAFLEADICFPSAAPLDQQSHNQCGLKSQQSDNTDDPVSITLPETGFNEQNLGVSRPPVLVKFPAVQLSPVEDDRCIRKDVVPSHQMENKHLLLCSTVDLRTCRAKAPRK